MFYLIQDWIQLLTEENCHEDATSNKRTNW
jgi:hypothetical protein